MDKRPLLSFLFLTWSVVLCHATNLSTLLGHVKAFQEDPTCQSGIQAILEVAKSEDYEPLVVQCMVVYTLYAGSVGDAATCQNAYQSVCKRYPLSDSVRYLRSTMLFSEPCAVCQGIGIVQRKSLQGCTTCNKSGTCTLCGGKGKIKATTGLRGPVRIGTWYGKSTVYNSDGTITQQRVPVASYGTGQATQPEELNRPCPVCAGSGKCRSCKGDPTQTDAMVTTTCMACKGQAIRVNSRIAKAVLPLSVKLLHDLVELAVNCESAYEKALSIADPYKQLDELNLCLVTYEKAFNVDLIRDAKDKLEKNVITFQKLHEQADASRAAKKAQQEDQQRLLLQQQEDILRAIQETKLASAGLKQLKSFIAENEGSPLLVRAKLLESELEHQISEENRIATRNRHFIYGSMAVAGLAGLVWLLSSIRFTKKVQVTQIEIVAPNRFPAPQTKQKIPFKPHPQAAQPSLMLQLATAATPQDQYAQCPECGAMLCCPPSVQNRQVTCFSCNKPFLVN